MILTITPNPALDVTYHLRHVRWGDVNRVETVSETAGGKGVNVARVLHQLGESVTCTGFLGGETGERLRELLTGVEQRWIPVPASTRRTTAVVAPSGTTLFNEPGASVPEQAWSRLRALVTELVDTGDVVVVSGSMPPGTTDATVAALVGTATGRGARVVVDTSGPLLRAAARAGATLVKPNHHELRAATGLDDVVAGARVLLSDGAGCVVVSRGEVGMLAVAADPGGPHRMWTARPDSVVSGNPTGAGDAAVAALARALHRSRRPVPELVATHLADAVALSAAAVARPVAGEVDLELYRRTRDRVPVSSGAH
ncbi:1-phosphofructokinase family hexose kinase [Saccharomonospora glauca]|jgi:1-phosphofructokinase family hexose kinase|uniref:Hexose kinase, 1-phosphofructokinase family n=1 Tax=Saccharomonospora glauca K62 TaxID=928724 RepID=I1D1H5_9PSEU|nr:1-phosphofructokinase family hexose kinase [Saccharomonospora glauca]EIE98799.1 hexose kinase, 1-phosphofructokinase family [Saccharomonospora glauca K62]